MVSTFSIMRETVDLLRFAAHASGIAELRAGNRIFTTVSRNRKTTNKLTITITGEQSSDDVSQSGPELTSIVDSDTKAVQPLLLEAPPSDKTSTNSKEKDTFEEDMELVESEEQENEEIEDEEDMKMGSQVDQGTSSGENKKIESKDENNNSGAQLHGKGEYFTSSLLMYLRETVEYLRFPAVEGSTLWSKSFRRSRRGGKNSGGLLPCTTYATVSFFFLYWL